MACRGRLHISRPSSATRSKDGSLRSDYGCVQQGYITMCGLSSANEARMAVCDLSSANEARMGVCGLSSAGFSKDGSLSSLT